MRVVIAGIIVDVRRMNVSLQNLERLRHLAHDMSMTQVETHAYVVKMAVLYELHQLFRSRQFVGNVFQKDANAQRLGESAQVLDRGHGGLEFAVIECLAAHADVLDQKTEGNLLRYFDG